MTPKPTRLLARASSPSKRVAAALLPFLAFTLLDGPRAVAAAESRAAQASAVRAARGRHDRGAGLRLASDLRTLSRELAAPAGDPAALARRVQAALRFV